MVRNRRRNPDDVCLAGTRTRSHSRDNLVRMSQGKMMGVDFNVDRRGSAPSIALHEEEPRQVGRHAQVRTSLPSSPLRQSLIRGKQPFQMSADMKSALINSCRASHGKCGLRRLSIFFGGGPGPWARQLAHEFVARFPFRITTRADCRSRVARILSKR